MWDPNVANEEDAAKQTIEQYGICAIEQEGIHRVVWIQINKINIFSQLEYRVVMV